MKLDPSIEDWITRLETLLADVSVSGDAATLQAALRDPAHAYLLHGPAGTGKRDAARAFAAALLGCDGLTES